jgi:hypothetical protein
MSALSGKAENICSHRAFPVLTLNGPLWRYVILQVWRLRPWPTGVPADDAHRAIGAYQALYSSGGAGRATVQLRMLSLKGSKKDYT